MITRIRIHSALVDLENLFRNIYLQHVKRVICKDQITHLQRAKQILKDAYS